MARASILLAATLCLPLLAACVHHHHGRHAGGPPGPVVVHRGGPPPHAPAHGYRHKHHHHGVELEYDSRLGVYVVVGLEGVFFHADHFYRRVEGAGWQISIAPDRDWHFVDRAKIPPGLAGKSKHSKGRGKRKGPHPAKHRY